MTKEQKVNNNRMGLKVIILFGLIAVVFLSVLISMNKDFAISWDTFNLQNLIEQLNNNETVESSDVFSLAGFNVTDTAQYQGKLLVLTNSDIRLLNANGEEAWYYAHEMRQPVLTLNDKWILVYEKSGKSYMVIENGRVILRDKVDEEIAFGKATDKYLLFISVSTKGYKRTIYFIDQETGIELGALYIDDFFPYYASTFNDEKYFILYGLGTNSTSISTIIRVYDSTLLTNPIANTEIEGLSPVIYNNNKTYMSAGKDTVLCYDTNLDMLYSHQFQSSIVAAGLFQDNGFIAAVDGEENAIYFHNLKGEEIAKDFIDNSIQSIIVYNNIAAIVCGSEVLFYNSAGKLISNTSLPGININVHFVNDERAFLVTENEATLFNIK